MPAPSASTPVAVPEPASQGPTLALSLDAISQPKLLLMAKNGDLGLSTERRAVEEEEELLVVPKEEEG